MTTIADFRTRVKAALGVSGTSTERGYEDGNIDQHIKQAVAEFSIHLPVEAGMDLSVSPASRSVSTVTLTRVIRVVAVETPIGTWPRALVDFDRWGTTLTMDIQPQPAFVPVRVYFEQAHLVDDTSSTIAPEHEHVIVEGAAALAVLARAAGAAQTLETATEQPMTYQHLRIAQSRLASWRNQIRRLAGGVGRRRLYVTSSRPVETGVVSGV